MILRDHRSQTGDFSTDRGPGPDSPGNPRQWPIARRSLLSLCLAVVMLTPSMAMAQETGSTESTTETLAPTTPTTGEETTSTTAPTSSTTSDPTSSTTSNQTPITTTVAPTTSTTTVTSATSTTAQEADPGDPMDETLEAEEEEDEPELLPLPSILFPVVGGGAYGDTYGAPRDGGAREHKGTDISAERGTPVVAVASGVVERLGIGPNAGLHVVIRHSDGWRSAYLHLNNDSPGTDNGLSMGYGPGVEVGTWVEAGTVIGYVGDSGNAEETSSHLHFELHQPDGYRANPYPALREARLVSEPTTLATVDYDQILAQGIDVTAHLDPGSGFNGEVAVLEGHAYLGTLGNDERCPGTGVRVIDVADPTAPLLVTSFADHTTLPGTAAPVLWVGDVETETFQGRLGVVGLERCGNDLASGDGFAGFAVYDLSDPADPVALSSVDVGERSDGITELDVSVSEGQVLLATLVADRNYGSATEDEAFSLPEPEGTPGPSLDLYDLSAPEQPAFISTWQPSPDPDETEEPVAAFPGRSHRLVWLNHERIAAGLEDRRAVVLDLTDPTQPTEAWDTEMVWDMVGPADLQPGSVIDGHSLIVDERLTVPEIGVVGRQVVVDSAEDLGTPIGAFIPSNIDDRPTDSGFYLPNGSTQHSANISVVSWMSGGVRVVDLEDPSQPLEIAHFVPAPAFDPQRWWTAPDGTTQFPMVWDIAVDGGYLYVSDHHSGLWILEITLPDADPRLN
jgi:murein DD-endopeptidase MepM/ murein hydrolase activator NlpD